MKIALGSDIHLEFGMPIPERDRVLNDVDADVLVLAGDITTAQDAKKKDPSVVDFFQRCVDNFEHVIYVMGNHEHYKGTFQKTPDRIRDMLPDGVHFLENEMAVINDIPFLGSTLWTSCNDRDYFTMEKIRTAMSDYRVIKFKEPDGRYRKLVPEDTVIEHERCVKFLKENMTEGCVVVTHHLPTFMSVNPIYSTNKLMNGGYASNLSEMMLEYNPKVWVHGHTHHPCEYEVGETTVHCNPRGYYGHEVTEGWSLKVFEV